MDKQKKGRPPRRPLALNIFCIMFMTLWAGGIGAWGAEGWIASPPQIVTELEGKPAQSKDLELLIAPPDFQNFRRLYHYVYAPLSGFR